MSRADKVFKPALENKKIPILTLDNKWHRLFTQLDMEPRIQKMADELNELIKRQGKLNTETKQIRKIKAKLMDEIVALRGDEDSPDDKKTEKQIEEKKRLINECNEKIDEYQEELLDLPRDIDAINYQLMLESMEVCYQMMKQNTEEINEIADWVTEIRIELKKKLIYKQEKEIMNQELYSYMHNIFGAEVIEIFDMKYNPEQGFGKESQGK